jgi:hypothetical protein
MNFQPRGSSRRGFHTYTFRIQFPRVLTEYSLTGGFTPCYPCTLQRGSILVPALAGALPFSRILRGRKVRRDSFCRSDRASGLCSADARRLLDVVEVVDTCTSTCTTLYRTFSAMSYSRTSYVYRFEQQDVDREDPSHRNDPKTALPHRYTVDRISTFRSLCL